MDAGDNAQPYENMRKLAQAVLHGMEQSKLPLDAKEETVWHHMSDGMGFDKLPKQGNADFFNSCLAVAAGLGICWICYSQG